MDERILEVVHAVMNRRTLLKGAMGAAALAATARYAQGEGQALAQAAPFRNDVDILNFALTLEHLENRAYRDALASGRLSPVNAGYFRVFGQQEAEHVQLITAAVQMRGGQPVQEQARYNFPAFTDEATVVTFIRTLEDVGVGAYTGASPYIADKMGLLPVAGGILNVEARHTAILRRQNGRPPAPDPLDQYLTPDQVLAQARPILGQ